MPKINIIYHGVVRNVVKRESEQEEVPNGFTLGDLFNLLINRYGNDLGLGPMLLNSAGLLTSDVIIAVNGIVVNDLKLELGHEGMNVEIAIIPAMGGGSAYWCEPLKLNTLG